MAAKFRELLPWTGVDDKYPGGTGMVAPLGASNFVALEDGKGLRVTVDKSFVEIKEISRDNTGGWNKFETKRQQWRSLVSDAAKEIRYHPPVDSTSRVFEITGKKLGGLRGARVTAVDPRTPSKVAAELRVVVLKEKPVKLAIRPVQVRDPSNPSGGLVYHSQLLREKGFDGKALLAQINVIWNSQTNVVFTPGLTTPAAITDEALIAKTLGLKAASAALPERVDLGVLKDVFKDFRDPGADFTIFLVKKAASGGDPHTHTASKDVAGNADSVNQMCVVGDEAVRYFWVRTMAHETGHFVGRYRASDGAIHGFPDLHSDSNLLMRSGGGGCKIPLEHTITSLGAFNAGY